jgi:Domain of unknown function (DUF4394)
MKKSKKTFIGMTFLALALAAISAFVLMGRQSVSAAAASSASAAVQSMNMPVSIYAVTTDNVLYVLPPGGSVYFSLGRITGIPGVINGIDFRPSNRQLYALSELGRLYTINLNVSPPSATLVSTLTPRFPSGVQSLMDFNPVVDAIRLIGSDRLNYAVVRDANGILNTTAVQTSLAFAAGDVNAGVAPHVSCGSYTNNVNGAATTLFYGVDYDLDVFLTIADKTATGSSNTGGGQLQTIGPIVDIAGNRVTLDPLNDFDITTMNGVDTLVGISRNISYLIPLNQINLNLPLGTTQNVVINGFNIPFSPALNGAISDVALSIP